MFFDGTLSRYAGQSQAEALLFMASAMEGALLPVPTDDLLVPMVLLDDKKAFRYAAVATVGSVLGALVAFEIAFAVCRLVAPYLESVHMLQVPLAILKMVVVDYSALIVLAAGLSAAPYKIVTFLSGFMGAGIFGFVVAGLVSRAARFFTVAWLLWRGGPDYKVWMERNFYGISTVASLALLLLLTLAVFLLKTA